MDDDERPEKRRKLEGDNEDGVPPLVPRSPRILLNKINISDGVLERLRKIKKLARERVLTIGVQKPKDENEVSQDVYEKIQSNTESIGLLIDDHSNEEVEKINDEIDQGRIKLWESNDHKDDTIEVLETGGQWVESESMERNEKRKHDDNGDENVDGTSVKMVKLYADKCVAELAESSCFSVVESAPIIKGVVSVGNPTTMVTHTVDQNIIKLSEVDKQGIAENVCASGSEKKEKMNASDNQTKMGNLANSAKGKEVEVAKVAQIYAKSGAQPELKKKLQSCDSRETMAPSHSDGRTNSKSADQPKKTDQEDELVYQLLKDVIETRTNYFEKHLLQKNAKLEKRIEHLERENTILQRTSKRLHLALQEVFKNREKAKQSRTSRGVQVNMNIRLSRTMCQKTSTVNIDVPEQGVPPSVTLERSHSKQEVAALKSSPHSRSSPSSSSHIPEALNIANKELMSLQKGSSRSTTVGTETPKTNNRNKVLQLKDNDGEISTELVNAPKSVSSGADTNVNDDENETRLVTVTTIGIQTQESAPSKKIAEGMGHFRLDPRYKRRNCGNHNSSLDTSETGHFRITPRGLEAQPKFATSKIINPTTESLQDRSRDFSRSSTSTEARINKLLHEQVNTNQSRSPTQHQKKMDTETNTLQNQVATHVMVPRGAQSRNVPGFLSGASNERNASRTPSAEIISNGENLSTNATNAKTMHKPASLPTSVTANQDPKSKYSDQPSPLIPKHSINPFAVSKQQSSHILATSKTGFSQGKEAEPEVIIVSSTERSLSKPPRLEQREGSTRALSNNVSFSEKERVDKQTEQSRRPFSNPSLASTREASNGNMGSFNHRSRSAHDMQGGEMKGQSHVAPSSGAQSNQISRPPFKNPNRTMQVHEQQAGNTMQTHSKEAPDSTRHVSHEVRIVNQARPRENVPMHPGPGYPPHMMPSQALRPQEQIHSPRFAAYDVRGQMRHPRPSQQGLPRQAVPTAQLPRLPVAINDVRTQHPSAHPMPQQQHIVVRQHHPQQQPNVFPQQQVSYTPQYVQQNSMNSQQTNIPRPQGQAHFQTHPPLQQTSPPMVPRNISTHQDPRSPEFAQANASMPLSHNVVQSHVVPGKSSQHQAPVVVYQPGALEGTAVRPSASTQMRNFDRYPPRLNNVTQIQNRLQGPQHRVPLPGAPQQRPPYVMDKIPPRVPNQADPRMPQRGPDRRPHGISERPQVIQPPIPASPSPPKPSASIAVVENGIVLSWNISPEHKTDNIDSYELFACQDDSNSTLPPVLWKKIGVVKALPLPMACTLTQFSTGSRYQFAVRAVDTSERAGPFSDPCVITLKKP